MTDTTAEPVKIDGYHAHVYYDTESRPAPSGCARRSPPPSASRSGS
jgi:hypothetical protein